MLNEKILNCKTIFLNFFGYFMPDIETNELTDVVVVVGKF